ncbi:unnamed protein product [Auanema sp. JU1783]|nr:unnamed protein product [Auanema sp. JU1783]
MENGEKKKKGIRLVSRKSTKKMLGRWKRLESSEKIDLESEKKPVRMIMGKSLSEVVELDPSLDGIPLPTFFRYSLDYVEKNGLILEGIYRISSPKSRLDELESNVNEGKELVFRDAHEAAGLIKRFLRQLPEQLVPNQVEKAAEACKCDWKTICSCGATKSIKHLLNQMEKSQYYLLTYVFLHAQNVVKHECDNKMGIPALGLLLQTVLEMSRKLICIFIQNASSLSNERNEEAFYLFPDVHILT